MKTKAVLPLLHALFLFVLSACEEGSGIRERADLEARTSVEAANRSRDERAQKMEADLASRHRFYQGVRGTYEGTLEGSEIAWRIRITLDPTLHADPVQRTRLPEEIATELSILAFRGQLAQWDPASPLTISTCGFDSIRADLGRGEILIGGSTGCPSLYRFRLAEEGSGKEASDLASLLRSGNLTRIDRLTGTVQASRPDLLQMDLRRVEDPR